MSYKNKSSLFTTVIDRLPRKYLTEMILLAISLVIMIGYFGIYLNLYSKEEKVQEPKIVFAEKKIKTKKEDARVYVHIAGSVNNPGVYLFDDGSRLKDVIEKAGGISKDADEKFFNRVFNLASEVQDQEKVYIPSKLEVVEAGINYRNKMPKLITFKEFQTTTENKDKDKVNINEANLTELQIKLNISKKIAEDIVKSRPYKTISDLLLKDAVSAQTFSKIKNLVSP